MLRAYFTYADGSRGAQGLAYARGHEQSRIREPEEKGLVNEREIGLGELLEDPQRTEALLRGRRGFLRAAGFSAVSALVSGAGWTPAVWASATPDAVLARKAGLRLLGDRPLNAETPAHLLDPSVTPTNAMFVRNNGLPPRLTANSETVSIDGESCLSPRTFTVDALRREFETVTLQLQLECGGNGRAEFRPRVPGNQWTTGAIGCPRWTGVRLRDVLNACGVREDAVYVAYVGADLHLSGNPDKRPISRGAPIAKAMEAESLIAWEMNGAPLPIEHGAPLRLVMGGWPGSVSGKWLRRIMVRNRIHDGPKMGGSAYRIPCTPIAPGTHVASADMCIIGSMPVKSLITSPRSGARIRAGSAFEVRGHAWAGDRAVARVDLSTDFGATWQTTTLEAPANRLAWQRFRGRVRMPTDGYHEVWARATDASGTSQPMLVPGWNPKGYLNNAAHRIALQADA